MVYRVQRKSIVRTERTRSSDEGQLRSGMLTTLRAEWLPSRPTGMAVIVMVILGFALAVPAAAQSATLQDSTGIYTLGSGRIAAAMAAVAALLGVASGTLSLRRSSGRGKGRRGAILALVLGPIGLTAGGLVVATANGGLGTGNGLGGGVVAMVLGLASVVLGCLALARPRHTEIEQEVR